MKKLMLGLIAGVLGIALVIGVSIGLSSENTVEAKKKQEAVLEFTIGVSSGASVEAIVDAVRKAANIGSSGQDGFQVDSFFDIEYRIDFSDDGKISRLGTAVVDIEIHAVPNSPDLNPGAVIDNVQAAVGSKEHEFIGHVTLLR